MTDGQTSTKSKKIVAKFFCKHGKLTYGDQYKKKFISPGRSRTPAASEMTFFVAAI